ncbi:MAG TPA: hypothetical protein VF490_10055 [Chryseosolibacter sp.]
MKLRFNDPLKLLLWVFFSGIFIFFVHSPASAQCKGEFSVQPVPSEKQSASGQISISIKDPEPGTYTFTVFRMEGTATQVQKKEVVSPDKVTIEGLTPSTYFVKVEWGNTCYRTLGGMDGISITPKEEIR